MGCFTSRKGSAEVDEIVLPRILLKMMFGWPENRNIFVRVLAFYNRAGFLVLITAVTTYLSTDGINKSFVESVQSVSDWLAAMSIITKDYYIRRNASEILKIRTLLTEDFKDTEKSLNVRPIRLKRRLWPWTAPLIMIPMSALSFIYVAIHTYGDREDRATLINVPTAFLRNDFIYFPFIIIHLFGHYSALITYVTADGLFISFTSVLRDKALTLNAALKGMSKCTASEERQKYFVQLVRYHHLICKLHKMIEFLLNETALAQILLVLFSVGILLVRILNADMPIAEAVFTYSYLVWVLGQLTAYCVLGDEVTEACMSISNAGYKAFQPGMEHEIARGLQLLILRAQYPIKMTAKRFITLNNKTLMEIIRRSYSIFSAISRMK